MFVLTRGCSLVVLLEMNVNFYNVSNLSVIFKKNWFRLHNYYSNFPKLHAFLQFINIAWYIDTQLQNLSLANKKLNHISNKVYENTVLFQLLRNRLCPYVRKHWTELYNLHSFISSVSWTLNLSKGNALCWHLCQTLSTMFRMLTHCTSYNTWHVEN